MHILCFYLLVWNQRRDQLTEAEKNQVNKKYWVHPDVE